MRNPNHRMSPSDDETANAMQKAIMVAHGPRIKALLKEAVALAATPGPALEKKERLLTIGQKFSDIVTPETPCKNGCSHCCYMATGISRFEAEMISRYTGKALATQGNTEAFMAADGNVEKYAGVPCTFLKEGKCSIYVVRPLTCRTHHNLAASSDNCKIQPDLSKTPCTNKLNTLEIDVAFVELVLTTNDALGDIREFFPSKEQSCPQPQ